MFFVKYAQPVHVKYGTFLVFGMYIRNFLLFTTVYKLNKDIPAGSEHKVAGASCLQK